VNGRWVQDVRLSAAVLQAYHTMLMVGRFPIAIIMLTLPPEDVDVNVHPTKAEVRFRSYEAAFSAVERAVRKALVERAPIPHLEARRWDSGLDERDQPGSRQWPPEWRMAGNIPLSTPIASTQVSATPQVPPVPGVSSVPDVSATQSPLPAPDVPLLRVIGQVGAAYIVAEGPDGLYLIDQHAAHERVLYEAFSLQRAAEQVVSQALIEPVAVEVPPDAAALLQNHMSTLKQIGFSIEPFG